MTQPPISVHMLPFSPRVQNLSSASHDSVPRSRFESNLQSLLKPEVDSISSGIMDLHDSGPEFIVFPQLPTELRLQIWEHTFVPRTIKMHSKLELSTTQRPTLRIGLFGSQPVAFSVCHESREHAKSQYQLLISRYNEASLVLTGLGNIWVNFERDTLRMNAYTLANSELFLDPLLVRYVVLSMSNGVELQKRMQQGLLHDWATLNTIYPNLRSLNLALGAISYDLNKEALEEILVDLDYNFENYMLHRAEPFGRQLRRRAKKNFYPLIVVAIRMARLVVESLRNFLETNEGKWVGLDHKMYFSCVRSNKRPKDQESGKYWLRWLIQTSSLQLLPGFYQFDPRDDFSRGYTWGNANVCYPDGELSSRYDGLAQLFKQSSLN